MIFYKSKDGEVDIKHTYLYLLAKNSMKQYSHQQEVIEEILQHGFRYFTDIFKKYHHIQKMPI